MDVLYEWPLGRTNVTKPKMLRFSDPIYYHHFAAVQTCPTDQLRLLEYYGLRASSLEASPVGGLLRDHT